MVHSRWRVSCGFRSRRHVAHSFQSHSSTTAVRSTGCCTRTQNCTTVPGVPPPIQKVLHPDEATVTIHTNPSPPLAARPRHRNSRCTDRGHPFLDKLLPQSSRALPSLGALFPSLFCCRCLCRSVRGAPLAHERPSRLATPPRPQPAASRVARTSATRRMALLAPHSSTLRAPPPLTRDRRCAQASHAARRLFFPRRARRGLYIPVHCAAQPPWRRPTTPTSMGLPGTWQRSLRLLPSPLLLPCTTVAAAWSSS